MVFNDITTIPFVLMQISVGIQILTILSTAISVIVVIVVMYLIRSGSMNQERVVQQSLIPKNFRELFFLTKDWDFDEHKTLLSSFLLNDECAILELLLTSLKEDGSTVLHQAEEIEIAGDGGWRNKHQMVKETGLSNRRVYDRNGIVERLVFLGLVTARDAPSPWGRQTHQYRANVEHPLIKSFFCALDN